MSAKFSMYILLFVHLLCRERSILNKYCSKDLAPLEDKLFTLTDQNTFVAYIIVTEAFYAFISSYLWVNAFIALCPIC